MADKIKTGIENDKSTSLVITKDGRTNVIYLGHIPHGFYEKEMKGFFSQFGEVTRLRLSRSRKTGRSRGYAFIEFEDPDVAKVVALTMNNYILFDKTLKSHVLTPSQINDKMFIHANKNFKVIPFRKLNRRTHNMAKTQKQHQKRLNRLRLNDIKKRKKIAALGLEYQFEGTVPILVFVILKMIHSINTQLRF